MTELMQEIFSFSLNTTDEYKQFEREVHLRVKRTARNFTLGVILPSLLYIAVVVYEVAKQNLDGDNVLAWIVAIYASLPLLE
eukprot:SAG31_NODE_25837_length_453_cov_0.728814_1_plen_81_part_10